MSSHLVAGLIALVLLLLLPGTARAQGAPDGCDGTALLRGLCLSNTETFDAIANLRGGVRRGIAGMSQTETQLTADLGVLAGLDGWTAQISTFLLLGQQVSIDRIGGMAPASNIEALATFRLNEMWIERQFGAWGSLRIGQLAADSEFAVAEGAINLVSGTFGWPVAFGSNLPGTGHGYPLPGPGARLTLGKPDAGTGLRLAIFAGNPAGRYAPDTDPQRHDRYGTVISFSGGALMIAEATTGGTRPDDESPRPWVAKLGFWYHNGGFNSQRTDNNGLPLASPLSDGQPWRYGNNHGVYTVLESELARHGQGAVMTYLRALAQLPDRSLVSLQVDGGLVWRNPFGRSGDAAALGVSWARIGRGARGYDLDSIAFGNPTPVRSQETLVELNYAFTVLPDRLWIQPLTQLILNPAAGAPDERRSPTQSLPNAVTVGLRAVARF
ncbi:carbohydrate porin [Roseomonas sp. CAU 1739]|uniref:carbohydrate porin n=1 Tax=Roseomonas sp. CAU 1739 TaxID=3140364 RepID=UPI00325C105D